MRYGEERGVHSIMYFTSYGTMELDQMKLVLLFLFISGAWDKYINQLE